jgi:hypothetical protein
MLGRTEGNYEELSVTITGSWTRFKPGNFRIRRKSGTYLPAILTLKKKL